MRFSFVPAAFAISIVFLSTASAAAIYKSTDAQGNVFFTDKPLSESSERLEITSRPTNNAGVQAAVQARLQRKALAAEALAAEALANAPAALTEDEKRTEARERTEKCNDYKERQTRFSHSRRIYRRDSGGERVYLDDKEMEKTLATVQDQVKEFCS